MLALQNKTLGQWLEHWAAVTPDKEYIVYSDRDLRFTWKEFNERVDRMAKGMLSIGVERHLGYQCAGLVDIPVCGSQDWCGCGYDQYELQTE